MHRFDRSNDESDSKASSNPGQDLVLIRSQPAIQLPAEFRRRPKSFGAKVRDFFCGQLLGRMATSADDIKSPYFWRAIVAELLGTLLLVFLGCGSCLEMHRAETVQIGISFGLAVATVVWAIGHVSGGHINPAVTVAMLATRKISLVRGILYIMAQMGGAVAGAALLNGVTHQQTHYEGVQVRNASVLGVTQLNSSIDISAECGLVIELVITFTLVLTVFASCDSKRDDLHGSRALSIGLSVTVCHFFAVPYTGSSMNPARSFGPVVITGLWANHWIYWVGPLVGGIFAALLYETVFASNASMVRTRRFLTDSLYDPSAFISQIGRDQIIMHNDAIAIESNGKEPSQCMRVNQLQLLDRDDQQCNSICKQ